MSTEVEQCQRQLALWRLMFSVCSRVAGSLDRQLQVSHSISLAEFEVLDALRSGPEDGVRMTALAEAASISKSRLSHCVDRLTDSGLVRRDRVDDDRRGLKAVLTDDGRKVCSEAAKVHESARGEMFGEAFAGADADQLMVKLTQIIDRGLATAPNFS
jgi:DNA-binding MarR family transcriptional regulator